MITKEDRIATGVVDYFRNALAAIGRHSRRGNEKYPPKDGSTELRWSFDVSTNHADAILSHLAQRGEIDPETGTSHTVALAWRALALLETELVEKGAKPGRAVLRGATVLVAHYDETIPAPPPVGWLQGGSQVDVEPRVEIQRCPDYESATIMPLALDRFAGLSGGPDHAPLHEGDEQ